MDTVFLQANTPTKKVVPSTDCQSLPKEVCGPETCPIVKGERICRDQVKNVEFTHTRDERELFWS